MSFLDANWAYRQAIAVDNSGAGPGSSDVSVTIPAEWDGFWGKVLSTGYDVRFTVANGRAVKAHKRTTWDYAARSAVFELDNVSLSDHGVDALWMYWGNAAAPDGATSPTITTPKPATIHLGLPTIRVASGLQAPGQTAPPVVLAKAPTEAFTVWFDFRSRLVRAASAIAQHDEFEEIASLALFQVTTGGAPVPSMATVSGTVFLSGQVGVIVKDGTSGTNYTLTCRVLTTQGRTLEARAGLRVLAQSGG